MQELGISADVFCVIKWHKIDRPRKKKKTAKQCITEQPVQHESDETDKEECEHPV